MKKSFPQAFFCIFLALILIFEGLGLPNGHELSFNLILLMPFFLFFLDLIYKRRIIIPKKISFLFFLFLVLTLFSTILSVDVQRSFEYFLFYLSLYLIFVYVYNHKSELYKPLIFFIFAFSVIFFGYSIIIKFLFNQPWAFFLIPKSGYQFVYPFFQAHNHLGDFLVISLVLLLYSYINTKQKLYLFFFLFFIPPFLLSYSRSAYVSLSLTSVLLMFFFIKSKKIKILSTVSIFVAVIFLISSFFLFVGVEQARKSPILRPFHKILIKNFELEKKELLANRDQYLLQALSSFREKPFFGVGPSNFTYASRKYSASTFNRSSSSHNLFLDVLIENGIFSFVIFLLIIFSMILSSLKNTNSLFFVFLAMLINFQTDYTHTIYSFFLLFFIIAGLIWREKQKGNEYQQLLMAPLILSTLIFIMTNLIIWSNLAFKSQKPRLGFFLYPFNKQVCFSLTEEKMLNFCGRFYSGDFKVLENIGRTYEQYRKENEALVYYEKAYQVDQFTGFVLVKKIYTLKNKLEGASEARKFISETFCKYTNSKDIGFIPMQTKTEITTLFLEMKDLDCPKDL